MALGDFIYDPIPSNKEPSETKIGLPELDFETYTVVKNGQFIVNNQSKTNPIDPNTSSTLKDIIAEPSSLLKLDPSTSEDKPQQQTTHNQQVLDEASARLEATVGPAYMAGLGGQSDFDRSLLIPTGDFPRTGRFGGLPILYDQITTNNPNPNTINMAHSRQAYTSDDAIVLSLCDGMGGLALSLKDQWASLGYTHYIAVEKSQTARKVCTAANPKDATFQGVTHGLEGHNDIFHIKEKHISSMPKDSLKLIGGAAMCNDFTKLRLLPDRPDYKGPPRKPGEDPRPGLDGKYGKTFRQVIKIIGWVLKHHPNCKFLIENVDFSDMPKHWAEVNDALGKPLILTSRRTKRRRAWWHNFKIPTEIGDTLTPLDPNECLDPGRRAQKYHDGTIMTTHPIGGSWKMDDNNVPYAATRKPFLVVDEAHDEPQHLRPHEAEKLMGMKPGTTEGPDITDLQRLECIGKGWDIDISTMLLKFIKLQTLEDHAQFYSSQLANSYTSEQAEQGKIFYMAQESSPDVFGEHVRHVAVEDGIEAAAKIIALTHHFHRLVLIASANTGSILDSGAARHVSRKVHITDSDDVCRLTSFTGKETWTKGNGYIPMTIQDDLTGDTISIDVDDADYSDEAVSSLLSLCKLIRKNWKFNLELGSLYAYAPNGSRITLHMGDDDVLRLPHNDREGKEAEPLPNINPVSLVKHTAQAATSTFLHRLLNHSNPDKVHRTLGVTKGFKQPHSPLPGCYCTSCALANARKKGLSHKQYSVYAVSTSDQSITDGDDLYEDTDDDLPEMNSETEGSDSDTDTSEDSESEDDTPIPMNNVELKEEYSDEEDFDIDRTETIDYEWKAPTAGRTSEGKLPRFDLDKLKPFEVMFADEKSYDVTQRGGWTTSFVLTDIKSDAWFKVDETAKTDHPNSLHQIIVQNGVHLLDYPRILYTDGCGSMRPVRDKAILMGINHHFIPPYDSSLNQAENICDRAWAAARTHIMDSDGLPSHMALAVDFSCYMKLRMATTASRSWLTPYEIIKGYAPNISHCVPFYTRAFVTVPKQKRVTLRKKGQENLRAEEGRLVGYQDLWGTTPKILLSENRIVHSRNVTYDLSDYQHEELDAQDSSQSKSNEVISKLLKELTGEGCNVYDFPQQSRPTTHENPLLTQEGATLTQEGAPQEGELQTSPPSPPSPMVGSPYSPTPSPQTTSPEPLLQDVEVVVQPLTFTASGRPTQPPSWMVPSMQGQTYSETINSASKHPREQYLYTINQIIKIDNDIERFDAQLEAASRKLNAAAKDGPDVRAYLVAAAELAQHSLKDMSWREALQSDKHRQPALDALTKELNSLTSTILTELYDSDPDYEIAVREATPGRILLDIKRSGMYKCRGVKQGFREDLIATDGPDFNYASSVVKFSSVRTALARRRGRTRILGIKDVSTAFLQSHKYPKGMVKYISFKHPLTNKWHYYKQSGPIYGEASAPIRWEETIAPWLVSQGFERGENDKGVFYHRERDLLLLLFVDDVLADGEQADVEWIFDLLATRFECKDADYITPDTPQDYLGMNVHMDADYIYLSMATYITNACKVLNIDDKGRSFKTPISQPIDTESPPLPIQEKKTFLTGLGMLGWLAQTVRPDVAYAYSRIGQHAANPTTSSMNAVSRAFRYLLDNKYRCLRAPLHEQDRPVANITMALKAQPCAWRFFCDSDQGGNAEQQNKRRAQSGLMVTYNGMPVMWSSKASSVCFASPLIGESHADTSSAAHEIYAAGNGTQDILGYHYVVEEMGLEFPIPFTLEVDNEAAKIFMEGNAKRSKLRHIDCRQEWVKIIRDRSVCIPIHVASEDNLADIFTKILTDKIFEEIRDQILFVFVTE